MGPQRFPAVYVASNQDEPRQVSVVLAPHGFAIEVAGGQTIWWPFEQTACERLGTLTRFRRAGAELRIDDPAFVAALYKVNPRLARGETPAPASRLLLQLAAVAGGLVLLLWAFFVYGLPLVAAKMAALVPVGIEKQLGRISVESMAPSNRRCRVPAVEQLIERLAAAAPSPYEFHVWVIDDPMVNAFAAPGGSIVVFRGMVEKTRRQEELAAVLAHEMIHVMERHSLRGLMRGLSLWALITLVTGAPGDLLPQLAGTLGALAYQREDELAADAGGVHLLNAAGIDPSSMRAMLERLREVHGELPAIAQWFSSHPLTEDRIERARRLAERLGKPLPGARVSGAWPPSLAHCMTNPDSTL